MAAKSKAKAACVIGWPVEHSRSPLIHGYWIKKHKLNAEYRREAVSPEQFEDFVAHLAERGYVGANVTIPNKEAARALSKADDRADKVGAANTLWLDGATLRSTNTDVEGFINNLDASAAGLEPRPGYRRGIGRRRNRARRRLWTERARREAHPRGQPHARSRDGAARGVRQADQSGALGGTRRAALQRRAAGEHHVARHDRQAAADRQPGEASRQRGGRGRGLCAAGDRAARRGARRAGCAPSTVSGCCCIRRCAVSSCGSACGRR